MGSAKCFFIFENTVERQADCQPHGHPCTEIVLNRRCCGTVFNDNQSAEYADHTLFVYQPGSKHWIKNGPSGFQLCIGVLGCDADTIPFAVYPTTQAIEELATKILAEAQASRPYAGTCLDLLVGLLVVELLRSTKRKDVVAAVPYHADAARKYLDERFDQKINISDLATALFISPDYLRQLFRETFGESPMHYLIRRRVEHACHLLWGRRDSVGDIARQCGIDNPYYFSKIFRKITGFTPSAYREKYRRKE